MPLNPSLKLRLFATDRRTFYVNILRTILERNIAFQWFFPLIKFCGKEFQNYHWRACFPVDTEQELLLTLGSFPFSHLLPPLPPMWHPRFLVSLGPGETELSSAKWELIPCTRLHKHHIWEKIILMVSPNCWVFNILSNKLFFFFK